VDENFAHRKLPVLHRLLPPNILRRQVLTFTPYIPLLEANFTPSMPENRHIGYHDRNVLTQISKYRMQK
jgi:hypothetical protein